MAASSTARLLDMVRFSNLNPAVRNRPFIEVMCQLLRDSEVFAGISADGILGEHVNLLKIAAANEPLPTTIAPMPAFVRSPRKRKTTVIAPTLAPATSEVSAPAGPANASATSKVRK